MVKKLIKHEFIYYIRTLAIFLPILLVFGIMTRILQIFENPSSHYLIVFVSSMIMLYISSFVCLFFTFILSIVRFYKNLYTSEGYLTYTLPISNSQHIFVKLIVSVSCYVISIFTVIITWVIAGSGFEDIWNSLGSLISGLYTNYNGFHITLYIIEIIICLLVALIYSHLLFYTCITIGQTAKKNRILVAVGAYFAYYMITQILGTIFLIFITLFNFDIFIYISDFILSYPYASLHILFLGIILIYGGLGTLFYYITLKIMNKKLNLE